MVENYSEDDLIMLSGIQHVAFCERQYALAYVEMQWSENILTTEGHHLHERVDDPFEDEVRGKIITWRALPLISYRLGLFGRADLIELLRTQDDDPDSIIIFERSGRWRMIPVEYKRGKPKPDERDEVQLCAQAICLEEMYGIKIKEGFLYYATFRHRHSVLFNSDLRLFVEKYARRMHEIFTNRITPPADFKPHCKSCSLKDICLPESTGNRLAGSEYLKNFLE